MFVIEGTDELGKTTMAKRVVEVANEMGIGATYAHMSRPSPEFKFSLPEYRAMMSDPRIVQDRFHLGAFVWHDNVISVNQLKVIYGEILSLGGMVVLLRPESFHWQRQKLLRSSRPQSFSVTRILEANESYGHLVDCGLVDHVVTVPEYPDDRVIRMLVESWQDRLTYAGML